MSKAVLVTLEHEINEAVLVTWQWEITEAVLLLFPLPTAVSLCETSEAVFGVQSLFEMGAAVKLVESVVLSHCVRWGLQHLCRGGNGVMTAERPSIGRIDQEYETEVVSWWQTVAVNLFHGLRSRTRGYAESWLCV